jgi:hypothetical protein
MEDVVFVSSNAVAKRRAGENEEVSSNKRTRHGDGLTSGYQIEDGKAAVGIFDTSTSPRAIPLPVIPSTEVRVSTMSEKARKIHELETLMEETIVEYETRRLTVQLVRQDEAFAKEKDAMQKYIAKLEQAIKRKSLPKKPDIEVLSGPNSSHRREGIIERALRDDLRASHNRVKELEQDKLYLQQKLLAQEEDFLKLKTQTIHSSIGAPKALCGKAVRRSQPAPQDSIWTRSQTRRNGRQVELLNQELRETERFHLHRYEMSNKECLSLQRTMNKLRGTAQRAKDLINAKQTEINEKNEEAMALRKSEKGSQDNNLQLTQANQSLQKELRKLTKAKDKAQTKLTELEVEHVQRSDANKTEIKLLRTHNDELKEKLKIQERTMQNEVSSSKNDLDEQKRLCKEAIQARDTATTKLTTKKPRNDHSKQNKEDASTIADLQKVQASLQSQLHQRSTEIISLRGIITRLESKSKVSRKDPSVKATQKLNKEVQARIDKMFTHYDSLHNKNMVLIGKLNMMAQAGGFGNPGSTYRKELEALKAPGLEELDEYKERA